MLAAGIIARAIVIAAAFGVTAIGAAHADSPPKPVAGQQIHFPKGTWSALPQVGPDGKVRQCVMVAMRSRAVSGGMVDTRLSIDISAGSGLVFAMVDDKLPPEDVLDDQAQVILDGQTYPAVGFTVANSKSVALHPGDAAAVLTALGKTTKLRLRSDGAGIDTGDIVLNLPADALAWLVQCGQQFNIAIDKPTDPNAPEMPAARPRSPDVAVLKPNASGLPGADDIAKIAGWDASEVREADGRVSLCYIRRRYGETVGDNKHQIIIAFMSSAPRGLTMAIKDTNLNLDHDKKIDATLALDKKPFTGFFAETMSSNEIVFFPQHGTAFGTALGDGVDIEMKSPVEGSEFYISPGVIPWMRACSRRWGWSFDAKMQAPAQ